MTARILPFPLPPMRPVPEVVVDRDVGCPCDVVQLPTRSPVPPCPECGKPALYDCAACGWSLRGPTPPPKRAG